MSDDKSTVAGYLAIYRTTSGDCEEVIHVEIRRKESHARLVVAEVSLADFALCVTGRAGSPAVLRLFDAKGTHHV